MRCSCVPDDVTVEDYLLFSQFRLGPKNQFSLVFQVTYPADSDSDALQMHALSGATSHLQFGCSCPGSRRRTLLSPMPLAHTLFDGAPLLPVTALPIFFL